MTYLPIFLILIRASAGISSGSSSSSSALNTEATVGFGVPPALGFDIPPRVILIDVCGFAKPILILLIRGGGGGTGTSELDSHVSELLVSKKNAKKHIELTLSEIKWIGHG